MKFALCCGRSGLSGVALACVAALGLALPVAASDAADEVIAATAETSLASGGEFAIRRQSIGPGARRASGGEFELVGSLGQPAVGINQGAMRVRSGFHVAAPLGAAVFADGFEAQTP